MKIIFLDIDGVFNTDTCKVFFKGFHGLEPRLVKLFTDWISQRDYNVVLSSTWRMEEDHKNYLRDNGISWIGVTPFFFHQRKYEIQGAVAEFNPHKYVILDDLEPGEFFKEQRPFLVQTSPRHGLQPKKLVAMDKILGDNNETITEGGKH